jgi:uncharacterized protein YgiM (DUF1202 family)
MQIFWKIVQFVLGFLLGLLITAGVTAGIAFFILTKLAKTPPKPLFAETISPRVAQEQITTGSLPTQTEETETPAIEVEAQEEGYRARVTWSDGLTVRSEPTVDSERLGGVEYDQELIVLETNPEETWQRIRLLDSNVQGWVKAGNLRKID